MTATTQAYVHFLCKLDRGKWTRQPSSTRKTKHDDP